MNVGRFGSNLFQIYDCLSFPTFCHFVKQTDCSWIIHFWKCFTIQLFGWKVFWKSGISFTAEQVTLYNKSRLNNFDETIWGEKIAIHSQLACQKNTLIKFSQYLHPLSSIPTTLRCHTKTIWKHWACWLFKLWQYRLIEIPGYKVIANLWQITWDIRHSKLFVVFDTFWRHC